MTVHLDQRLAPVLEAASAAAVDVDTAYRFPHEAVAALRENQLFGLTVPVERGGLGATPAEFAATLSALAQRCGSSAMVYLMHLASTMTVLQAPPSGDPDLVERMAADALGTLAFSERGSRSHFWAPVSHVEEQDGRRLLTAQKSFVTSAHEADVIVSSVVSDDGQGVDLYAVSGDAPGLDIQGAWRGMGLRGNDSAPISMAVPVREGDRLGNPGDGFGLMMGTVLPWFNLGNAAVNLGLATAAANAATAHAAGSRLEQLDQSLADLPTIRARLAAMQIRVSMLRAYVMEVAGRLAAPDDETVLHVLSIKAAANETALTVTDDAMRVAGGAAFASSVGIDRYFRDSRAGYVMAPTADVLHDFVGKAVAGMPLF